RPLIAFMGNTVNDKSKEGKNDELSDISNIVKYLEKLPEKKRAKFKNTFNGNYKGKLKLTRNPQADDEILLSYGTGDYWGIINVGNGLNFINNYQGEQVDKITNTNIIISNVEKYLFENIDKPQSPINILMGSRKFAEGWNCFRVSVIGLINLGKTKGNKIIQIFGRGVRLKGLMNDGKRKDISHLDDYFALKNNEFDNLKKLETLCVFSLQRSYLETFTEAVSSELEITRTYDIPVKPSILKINDNDVSIGKYAKELSIFKLSKTSINVKRVIIDPQKRTLTYEYMWDAKLKSATINNFLFSLDYRPDKGIEGINIKNTLAQINETFGSFINYKDFKQSILNVANEANMQFYCSTVEKNFRHPSFADIIPFINEIKYKEDIPELDFEFTEFINAKIAEEFAKKVKNKINWHLNSSIYEYEEQLKQSNGDDKGDFIEKYTLVKSFKLSKEVGNKTKQKTELELNAEIDEFTKSLEENINGLIIDEIGNHIYDPLLRENKNVLRDGLKLSPDKLNDGEKKFVVDFTEYVKDNPAKFKDVDVYLMRNVESLKSIGIYLNDDSSVFYPDFILWQISKKKIHINFIDPKGQFGLIDFETLKESEKVQIADKHHNQTLTQIEKELKRIHKKDFVLNSFLILRDSSDLGKRKSAEWKKENMIEKNILRLDWHKHDEKENKADQTELVEGKTYLDWMMERQ
ncbi:MAG: hypothetical protein QQN49_05190, partial [Nitrosopumilus sp.]